MAPLRLVHVADVHLGVETYGRLEPTSGLSTRLLDFTARLDEVVDHAIAERVDLFLFAGDAYRSRDPSPTQQREFARRIHRLSEAGIPVFLLVGNHDLPNASGRANSLDIFETLAVPGVTVGRAPRLHRLETRAGPIQVAALPWLRRSALMASEEFRSLTSDQARQAIQQRAGEVIRHAAEQLDPLLPAILCAHISVEGATYGSERSVLIGEDIVLPRSTVADPRFHYVALGHIHKHQVIGSGPPIVYPGSLERVDFGEENDPKGFVTVEIEDGQARHRFHPLAARRFVTIRSRPRSADPTEEILANIAAAEPDGAVARLIVEADPEVDARIDYAGVRRALKGAYCIAAIRREVDRPDRRLLASAGIESMSPGDALDAYLRAREVPDERRERLLEYGRRLAGDAVIPLTLRLRNFMSYGESGGVLDFGAFHVGCLCGQNGHGKSALLDAITWALWGRARGKSEDDLVQLGKLDMEVQLELALDGARYMVVRKRTLRATGKRRIATPMLELQIHDGEGYRPLTAESVQATQARLLDLLKLDYETFINSAYLMQGRADEFTLKSPAERKRVLADLLGLERYGRLEESAREESRRCQRERELVLSAVQEIDRALASRPTYEAELTAAGARIAQAEERRRLADAELARWRAEARAFEQRASQVEALRQRRTQDERECATLRTRLAEEALELARVERLVARGPEVRDAAARLADMRARDEQLSRQAADLLEVSERRAALEREVARAREGLVAELAEAKSEAARLQALAAQADGLARELQTAEGELAGLQALDERRDAQRQVVQRCQVERTALLDANARLKGEMDELKQNLERLSQAGATCPVCRGTLTANTRAAVEDQIEGEGKARAAEYRANAVRARELEVEAQGAQNVVVELGKRFAVRPGLESRVGTLRHQRDQAWAAAGAVVSLTEIVATLDARLNGEQFLAEEHAELRALVARIEATGYDRAGHAALRAEIAGLAPTESLRAEVEAAEAALAPTRARRLGTAELLETRECSLAQSAAQLAELLGDGLGPERIEGEVERASSALDGAIGESRAAHQALGVAQQQIEHCRQLELQRGEKVIVAARAAEEKTIYDDLALAFGKKGIQAMIIESAIPEIEAEANDLLGRLTDGGLSLSFETQREAKSGDGLIETLDIKISDEFGTRDYEMYSGGEAFRINFAIRVALSKLLVRRAGAQLQLLVVDEGFGTQDATGRDRLVEAINAVSSDFEKIVVVTHIQELKDAFPVRIEVSKGPEGSQIVATAVLEG